MTALAKCRHPGCDALAIWELAPADSFGEYCDDHVPRGCSCNGTYNAATDDFDGPEQRDVLGRLLPCCEYWRWPKGFEAGDPAEVERYRAESRRRLGLAPG